jgi:hypothetical protein
MFKETVTLLKLACLTGRQVTRPEARSSVSVNKLEKINSSIMAF